MERLGKTRSILPNSSNAILLPLGAFLVVWNEGDDRHILYRGAEKIAAHHNGFACHELAKRIIAGTLQRALEQFDYIKACGGVHYVLRERVAELL